MESDTLHTHTFWYDSCFVRTYRVFAARLCDTLFNLILTPSRRNAQGFLTCSLERLNNLTITTYMLSWASAHVAYRSQRATILLAKRQPTTQREIIIHVLYDTVEFNINSASSHVIPRTVTRVSIRQIVQRSVKTQMTVSQMEQRGGGVYRHLAMQQSIAIECIADEQSVKIWRDCTAIRAQHIGYITR